MREYLNSNDYSKIVDLEEKNIVVARFFYCKTSCFGVQEQFYFEIDASLCGSQNLQKLINKDCVIENTP